MSDQKLDVNQLRNDVENEIENEDHDKIAKICRTVLASRPNELLWLRLLCCAMIHLSQTKPLLTFIETYSNKHQIYNALLFYKIYCLYLLKENQTAQAVLNTNNEKLSKYLTEEEFIATQYLKYQILYRLGEYKSGINILNKMQNNQQYVNEIIVNEISTLIAMNESSQAIDKYYNKQNKNNDSLRENCDFVFNLGIALILCARTNEAKELLISSISKCENALSLAGYHENEIISEIGNLECLIAYCLYSLGDAEKALQYYRKLKDKQCINGIYENLILENNILANEYEMNDEIKEKENEKKEHEKHLLLYKKLLCHKNKNNVSRIGQDTNGITQLMKAYYNNCIILTESNSKKKSNQLQFKQLIALIRNNNPLSELPLFLKIRYFLCNKQFQQCRDILFDHLNTNPHASVQSQLYYVQILINNQQYKKAIKQIQNLQNDIKYSEKFINITLNLVLNKLKNNNLAIEIMKQSIEYLSQTNNELLLIPLQIKLCKLLIALNKACDAKNIAHNLYKSNSNNEMYKAILLLSAVRSNDMELAYKISNETKLKNIGLDEFAINELLTDIPQMEENNNNMSFSFEISSDMALKRKRQISQKKRQKNAIKIRQKYRESPQLYKDAINWQTNKKRVKNKNKTRTNKSPKNKKSKNKKKKKGFRGAQGGAGASNKFQVYDIGDARNKNKSGKKQIPQHIKKRKR